LPQNPKKEQIGTTQSGQGFHAFPPTHQIRLN
jgi:hypothetical protein